MRDDGCCLSAFADPHSEEETPPMSTNNRRERDSHDLKMSFNCAGNTPLRGEACLPMY